MKEMEKIDKDSSKKEIGSIIYGCICEFLHILKKKSLPCISVVQARACIPLYRN